MEDVEGGCIVKCVPRIYHHVMTNHGVTAQVKSLLDVIGSKSF